MKWLALHRLVVDSKLWRAWVELLGTKEPGTLLALFRIGVALSILTHMLSAWDAGVIDMMWTDAAYGGYRHIGKGPWLVQWLGGPNPEVVHRLFAANLLFSAALLLGIGGRLMPLLTLHTYMALIGLNGHAGGSYDPLTTNALWLLVLAPSTWTLSVDCYLRSGQWTDAEPVSAWVRYLAIFQMLVCYWTTGLQKVSFYWMPGGDFSALYYIFQQPTWQRFDMSWVAWLYPLTQLGTAVTWLWEVSMPLLLLAYWYRYTADRPGRLRAWFNRVDVRLWFVVLGASFHVLVHLFMNVGPFSFISLAYYPCFFSWGEWAKARDWVGVRWGGWLATSVNRP